MAGTSSVFLGVLMITCSSWAMAAIAIKLKTIKNNCFILLVWGFN
jgi:hypothetical protein